MHNVRPRCIQRIGNFYAPARRKGSSCTRAVALIVVCISVHYFTCSRKNGSSLFHVATLRDTVRGVNVSTIGARSTLKFCFVYDKRHRTGSTALESALNQCLVSKGFGILDRDDAESGRMYKLKCLGKSFVASTAHIWLTDESVIFLVTQCENLFYVTSTRPMSERVWSKAKYEIHNENQNYNLSYAQSRDAIDKLEKYKFDQQDYFYPSLGNILLRPHFVVRFSHFYNDSSTLLNHLGCGMNNVTVVNMHVGPGVNVQTRNGLHAYLMDIGHDLNAEGLIRLIKMVGELQLPSEKP
jgi:hypothetical protein